MADHIESKDVVARKPHRCWICLGAIAVGEKYHRTKHRDDYGICVGSMHMDCAQMLSRDNRKHLDTFFDDEGYGEGLAFDVFDWDNGEWLDKNAPTVAKRVREHREAKANGKS